MLVPVTEKASSFTTSTWESFLAAAVADGAGAACANRNAGTVSYSAVANTAKTARGRCVFMAGWCR